MRRRDSGVVGRPGNVTKDVVSELPNSFPKAMFVERRLTVMSETRLWKLPQAANEVERWHTTRKWEDPCEVSPDRGTNMVSHRLSQLRTDKYRCPQQVLLRNIDMEGTEKQSSVEAPSESW